MLRRILLSFVLLPLIISACNGNGTKATTSSGASTSMVGSVPENAVFLGALRLDILLKDAELQSTMGQTIKDRNETNGADIQTFLSGKDDYGIDPKGIKDIVFFGTDDVISGGDDKNAGILVKSRYDKEKVAAALNKKSDSPLSTQPYKGADVRASADGKNAIGFLESDLIVMGSTKMVQAVIDVRKGDTKALSGTLPSKFQSLGSPMIKLAAVLTPDSLKGLGNPEESVLPINTDFLTQLSSMSLSMDKAGDSVTFALNLDYPSNETAKRASDGINGLISLFKSGSNQPNVLESIKVRNAGKSTEITGKLKTSELKSLSDSFSD